MIGLLASNFLSHTPGGNAGDHNDGWDTGIGERGLDDQIFLPDTGFTGQRADRERISGVWPDSVADKVAIDSESPPASNGHPVQAKHYAWLLERQFDSVTNAVVDENTAFEPNVSQYGSLIDQSAIVIPYFQLGSDLSAESNNRAFSDSNILDLNEHPLLAFQSFPLLTEGLNGFIGTSPFPRFSAKAASVLRDQSQREEDPEILHEWLLASDSATILPTEESVKQG